MTVDSDRARAPSADRYGEVVLVLMGEAAAGAAASLAAAIWLSDVVFADNAILLLIGAGLLGGVRLAQRRRARPPVLEPAQTEVPPEPPAAETPPAADLRERLKSRLRVDPIRHLRVAIAAVAFFCVMLALVAATPAIAPDWRVAASAVAGCLVAAGLAMTAARYLAAIEPAGFPEPPGLCRWARVVAWCFVVAARSVAMAWAGRFRAIRILHVGVLFVSATVC